MSDIGNDIKLDDSFLKEIVGILHDARQGAYSAIHLAMVKAYWHIGKRITEEEQKGHKRAEYGSFLIKQLAIKLSGEFGKGFSIANLKNFRQFYSTFPDGLKSGEKASPLTWSHYRLIMRVESCPARNWYLQEAAGQNWTARLLERNIATKYFERLLSSRNKSEILLTERNEKQKPIDFIKDPFLFEFLNITDPNVKEADIENGILNHLQHFLLELGKGFSFVARQFYISTETGHFYLDLVFYNYILKCFVLFDLKTGKLNHQDVGQMDMYVRMFDDLKKTLSDGPTIGVILCADKDETIVKYSVLNGSDKLFASKYRTYLPTESELIEEIEREKHLIITNKLNLNL